MKNTFIVNGYGVPKNIFKDDNYHFYLNMVFNRVWDVVHNSPQIPSQPLRGEAKQNPPLKVRGGEGGVMLIFSGGPTDCFPPYKRTEAGEMKRYFLTLMRRDKVRDVTKHWKIVLQQKALTTVENLVYGKEKIYSLSEVPTLSVGTKSKESRRDGRPVGVQGYGNPSTGSGDIRVYYFCENTRFERSHILSTRVFPKTWRPSVIPIDFDVSPQRYLDADLIRRREEKSLQYELWALKSPENLKKWRKIYQERIAFLRKAGPAKHQEAVKEWWEKRLTNLSLKPK